MIDLVDSKLTGPRRLTVSEGIEPGSEDYILANAALDRLGKSVFSVSGTERKTGSPLFREGMIEQWRQPGLILIGIDQAWGNRVEQNFGISIDGLMERPHNRGNFDGPASPSLLHVRLPFFEEQEYIFTIRRVPSWTEPSVSPGRTTRSRARRSSG